MANPQHSTIPEDSCQSFIKDVLYPTWQARADVLKYCSSVATAPDPDDPEHVAREVYNRKGEERMVDERLDPYSGRVLSEGAADRRARTAVEARDGRGDHRTRTELGNH